MSASAVVITNTVCFMGIPRVSIFGRAPNARTTVMFPRCGDLSLRRGARGRHGSVSRRAGGGKIRSRVPETPPHPRARFHAAQRSSFSPAWSAAIASELPVRSSKCGLAFRRILRTAAPCCPFRLSVIGKVVPPVLRRLRVLVVSLKQQREIKHRIGVFWRGSQRPAQTLDCGF
jgi:hypothetical protein